MVNQDRFSLLISSIDKVAVQYPDKPAIIMKENGIRQSYTYWQLKNSYEKGRCHLESLGYKPGDRVALLSENRPEWILTYLSLRAAGLTVVILDATLSLKDLLGLIEFSDLKGIALSDQLKEKINESLPKNLVKLAVQQNLTLFEDSPQIIEPSKINDENPEIAIIIYTSGTVGTPKGVTLSEKSILANTEGNILACDMQSSDRIICPLPLTHIFSVGVAVTAALIQGSTLILIEKIQRDVLLNALQEEKPTLMVGVPRLYESLATGIVQQINQSGKLIKTLFKGLVKINQICSKMGINLSPIIFKKIQKAFGGSIKLLISGGAALPNEVESLFESWGFNIISGYGLTEFSPVISVNNFKEKVINSVGKPNKNTEVKIESKNPVAPGEICVRGPSLMLGYFRNPEDTKNVIIDGWLHTGDLGLIDHNGAICIQGRIKELIVTSAGKKIVPDEVEKHYKKIKDVKEVAVVGIRAPNQFGEEICLAVVPEKPILSPEENSQFKAYIEAEVHKISETITSYMRVQKVHIVKEIPKTSTLKVKRTQFARIIEKELYCSEKSESCTDTPKDEKSSETVNELINILKGEFPRLEALKIQPSSTLEYDLGIDSLGRLDLAAAINKHWQTQIDENKIAFALSVRDLGSLIDEKHIKQVNKVETFPLVKTTNDTAVNQSKMRVINIASFLAKLLWKVKPNGSENLPDDGGFILAPNHESHLDVLWVYSCLPKGFKKRLRSLAKKELFDSPFTKFLAEECGGVPVDRGGNVQSAVTKGVEILSNKNCLLIHPEGTRSRTGTIGEFHRGAAHLAIQTQSPLIPVYINGSFEIFPPKQKIPNFINWNRFSKYKVNVYFGKPIYPSKEKRGLDAEMELTAQLKLAVLKLKSEVESNNF